MEQSSILAHPFSALTCWVLLRHGLLKDGVHALPLESQLAPSGLWFAYFFLGLEALPTPMQDPQKSLPAWSMD